MSFHLMEERTRPGSFFPQVKIFIRSDEETEGQLLVRVILPAHRHEACQVAVEGMPEHFTDAEQVRQLGLALRRAAQIVREHGR